MQKHDIMIIATVFASLQLLLLPKNTAVSRRYTYIALATTISSFACLANIIKCGREWKREAGDWQLTSQSDIMQIQEASQFIVLSL